MEVLILLIVPHPRMFQLAWIGGGRYALFYIVGYVPVLPATINYLHWFVIYQLSSSNEYMITMPQRYNPRRRSIPQHHG